MRRLFPFLLFAFCFQLSAFGAVTLVNVSSNKADTATSMTIPTTATGGNFLLVAIQTRESAQNVTGVTYNGDALTHAATESDNDGNLLELWYMTAPDSGTHDVAITWSAETVAVTAIATTWSGVNQSTPIGTVHENQANDTPTPTNWCASASGEIGVVAYGLNAAGGAVGSGETKIADYGWYPAYNNVGMSYKAAGASVTEFGWTVGSYWVSLAVALKPAVGPTTYYVSTDGDNGADGSTDSPWATIRHGVTTMAGGDVLNIRTGVHGSDGFELDEIKSGTPSQPTIIQSDTNQWAMFYPSNFAHGILISGQSNIVLNGFEINGTNCSSDGIKLTGGTTNVVITNMTVRGVGIGMGILASGVDEGDWMGSLITHCRFITNGWGGPFDYVTNHPDLHQLYIQTSGMTVENCYFEGATNSHGWTHGIHYFGGDCASGVFRNNIFTNCNTGILAGASRGSNCWIYNNVLVGNHGWGIDVYQMALVYVLNNTCFSNTAGIQVRTATNVWVENNITVGGLANPGGILVTTDAKNVAVSNNLAYANWYSDFRVGSSFNIGTNANQWNVEDIDGAKSTNSTVLDAKFVNPSASNFRLQTGSDAIRRGKAQTSIFTHDAGGRQRGATNWSIGAWQYAPASHAINALVGTGRVLNP